MSQQEAARSAAEIQEIERHKYFLSEKAGFDVGWEAAESDWEQRYAAQWRTRREGDAPRRASSEHGEAARGGTATATEPKLSWLKRLFSRSHTVR